MGNSTPRDVQEAFYRVVHDRDVAKLAGMMGMSPGVLYNKANQNETNHHKPTLADGVVLTNLTGDKRIAQAFCHSVGGLYVELPDLSNLSTDALMMQLVQIEEEGGDFYRTLHDSLKSNDDITAKEYEEIEHDAHAWVSAILEGLIRIKEMSGGGK